MKSKARKVDRPAGQPLQDTKGAHLVSDERFRKLVEQLPTVLYTNAVGEKSLPLYISPHIKPMLGYTQEEWLADPELWSKSLHPDDRQLVLAQAAESTRNHTPFEKEYRMVARDGHVVWVHDQFILVADLPDQQPFWQGIMLDITGRKEADKQNQRSSEFLQSVQDALLGHISILDYEGNIVQVNAAWCDFGKQNGLTHPNHCIGMNYLDVCDKATGLDAEEAPFVASAIRDVRTGKKDNVSIEYPCHAPNEQRWFVARITKFENDDRRWIVVAHENITERKIAEIALHESEEKFRNTIQEASDGILICDEQGKIVEWNKAQETMFGKSRKKMVGTMLWDFQYSMLPEDKKNEESYQRLKCFTSTVAQPEYAARLHRSKEMQVVNAEGEAKTILVTVFTIVTQRGRLFASLTTDISERKQAEVALHESEERYRLLVETLPDGVIVHSQGRVVFANPASVRIIGAANPSQLIGRSVIEFVHPDLRKLVVKRIQQSLNDNIPLPLLEEKFVRLDGTPIDVEVSAIPFSYVGKPAMLTVFNDITERKHAEETLRLSEEKYRVLVDNVNDGFYVTDKDGVFTYANPAMARIYGVESPQALVGRKFIDFIPPDLLEKMGPARVSTMYTDRAPEVVNGQIVRPDGTRAFIEAKPARILEGGQVMGTRGVVRDTTERMQAEELLRVSEAKFRSYNESAPLGLFVADKTGRYVEVNSAAAKMLGYTEPELLKLSIPDVLAPQSLETGLQQFQKVVKDGFANAEFVFRGKDGAQFWATVLAVKLSEDRFMSYCQDITERKQAEEKMQRQLEHLTALSAIDRIISSIFDLKLGLSEILNHITTVLGIDAADILVLNPHSQMLENGADLGFRTDSIKMAHVRLGGSLAGRAILEHHLIKIPNLGGESNNLLQATLLKDEGFVSYFGVPLIAKGQVKGVLEVYHRTKLEPNSEWFDFLNTLAGQTAIAVENSTLFENEQRSNMELAVAYDATIEGWSRALDLRDKETEGHTQRVTEVTQKLARAIGLSEADLVQVRWGALLHDIGKMGVPDGILLKPGPLTDEEWVVMKKHPTLAYEMLSPIRYLRLALDIPYCHHEKWDGSGYPRGLKGDQIPLTARIFAVVDVWDALRSDRPYRAAWKKEKVREHIRALSGTHFDPQVVDVFMQMSDSS